MSADWNNLGHDDWQKDRAKAKERMGDARKYVENNVRGKADVSKRWGQGRNAETLDDIFGKERPKLPICPYGCGREGTLLEIVMQTDGRALGIFNDYPCSCIFVADIQLPEPPRQRKQKLVLGADGEYHMEESETDV